MKTYGQYCGLAKALDHVGDRWTLLIVRELLVDARRYSELRSSLPGIATNLLADRLRALEEDGIVTRAESDGKYVLTQFGRELEGAVHELVRWGARWMGPRGSDEEFRPEWLVVALGALLPKRKSGRIEIRAGDTILRFERGRVSRGSLADPDAVVEGAPEMVLGVAAGKLPLSALKVTGDKATAQKVLTAGSS